MYIKQNIKPEIHKIITMQTLSSNLSKIFFTLFLLIGFQSVQAQNTTWTGNTNTDWTNAANWTNGVPTNTYNVIIPNVANTPILVTAGNINNLTIEVGGILNIEAGALLTVNTDVTVGGTLNQATGTTIAIGGNFTRTGTFTPANLSIIEFFGTGNNQIFGTANTVFETINLNKTAGDMIFEVNAFVDEAFTIPVNVRLVARQNVIVDFRDNFIINGSILFDAPANYVANSYIRFSGNKNTVIGGSAIPNFRHLLVAKSSAANTVTANVDIITFASFRVTGGTFILSNNRKLTIREHFERVATAVFTAQANSIVEFNGDIESRIETASVVFPNLIINKTAANPATSATTQVRIDDNNVSVTVTEQLVLTRGRFVSTYNNRLLIIANGATTTAPTAVSFVQGPVRKIGNTAFTFPIGKNGRVGRLTITPTTQGADTDEFTAEYFGTFFGAFLVEAPLVDISNREYWRLERSIVSSTTASVTLHWENGTTSGLNGPLATIGIANLLTAQWNLTLSQWESRGNIATTGTVATNGTVRSVDGVDAFDVNSFWTLGYADDNLDWGSAWLGDISSNWHDPNNWSPDVVPNIQNDVLIIGERPNQPIISTANASAKSLNIPLALTPAINANPPATLTIDIDRTLTVGNNTTDGVITNSGTINNNGTIVNTNSFFNLNTSAINNNGTITSTTQAGTFVNGNSNNSTAVFNNQGTLIVSGNRNFDNNANATFNNLAGGFLVCQGAFRNRDNQGGGAVFNNNGTVQASRNFTNDRPFTGLGLVDFRSGITSTISGTQPITHRVDINKTGNSVILQSNMTILDDLTVPANITFQIGNATNPSVNATFQGNLTNNGTITAQANSTATFSGNTNTTLNGNMTLQHIIIDKTSGANLQINNNTTANGDVTISNGTLQINNGNSLSIAQNLINNASLEGQINSTVTFTGATAANISGTGTSNFHNLIMNKTANLTLNKAIQVRGGLNLTAGLINTDNTNLLIINDNATATSGNANSYINGPMRKVGDDPFVFPVGKGGKWARIAITDLVNTNINDFFTAEYSKNKFTAYTDTLPPIYNISINEYWDLDRGNIGGGIGTTEGKVTLYWENGVFSGIDEVAMPDLVVAKGNGTAWQSEGGDVVGTIGSGNVTSLVRINTFSPFTFGSLSEGVNPLPVNLLSFDAKKINANQVKLFWTTASEQNTSHFEVQRSYNATNFESFASVQAAGNSISLKNYETLDNTPAQGYNYYRLKMIDLDGSFKYSSIVAVKIDGTVDFFVEKVYPNPTMGEVNIQFYLPENEKYEITIFDMQGRIVKSMRGNNDFSALIENKIDLGNIQSGTYFIKLYSQGKQIIERIIKQ